MPVTVLVEPDPNGHRFQAVANVARLAGRDGDVLLLTSHGAPQRPEFKGFLSGVDIEVREVFDHIYPPTREMAAAIVDVCRQRDVATAVVMDADQSLKRWWYVARAEFRALPKRPRVVFFLTRYPAKVPLTDGHGWFHRISKGTLALLAMMAGTLDRVGGFAGREDVSTGWIVKRVRDPAICSAHSRDRAAIRTELDLPADRKIVGILGSIDTRKSAPMILDAARLVGDDVDLLLAGTLKDDVKAWVDALTPEARARLIVREGFLDDDVLDKLVATCDAVTVAQLNKGPSGIMGKALAAEVPVVSAGSAVRARELEVTNGGYPAEMTAASIAAALRMVFAGGGLAVRTDATPPATGETFAATLLGVELPATPTRLAGT